MTTTKKATDKKKTTKTVLKVRIIGGDAKKARFDAGTQTYAQVAAALGLANHLFADESGKLIEMRSTAVEGTVIAVPNVKGGC